MPGLDWLRGLKGQQKQTAGVKRKTMTKSPVPRPMKPPWLGTNVLPSAGPFTEYLLFEKSYHTYLPGVRIFKSMPDLLDGLLFDDLVAKRESMRRWNEEKFKPTLRWYRAAVLHLMSGPPHYFL